MKILVLCVCVLAAAGIAKASQITQKLAEVLMVTEEQVDTCMENTGFTEDDIKTLQKTRNSPDTDAFGKFGCFMACIGEERGVLVEGEFVMDKIKEFIDAKLPADKREKMYSVAEKCVEKSKGEDNPCLKTLIFVVCFGEKM